MSTVGDEVVLARFGELWLKGKNRGEFERVLVRNSRAALATLDPDVRIERQHGIVIVHPSRRTHEVARRLRDVFGYSSLSHARACESTKEAIAALAMRVFREALEGHPPGRVVSFRV